jgi:hypothetical protein
LRFPHQNCVCCLSPSQYVLYIPSISSCYDYQGYVLGAVRVIELHVPRFVLGPNTLISTRSFLAPLKCNHAV